MLGVGPGIFEDLEDFVKQASGPLTMTMIPLYMHVIFSSLLLMHRNHDEMVNHVGWLPRLLPR